MVRFRIKENTRTIAVVNMDQGIRVEQGITNYGTQMLNLINNHFYSTTWKTLIQARPQRKPS